MPCPFRAAALSCVAALALTACAGVTDPRPAEATPAVAGASYDQLLADVRILSADDMEGRDTGAPGGERARAYICLLYTSDAADE